MRYERPELGERLAADYVLGMMPLRARRRFERAMAGHATLAAAVAGWGELLAPLDATATEEPPPARIWQAIERRVGPRLRQAARWPAEALVVWRALALTAIAACAALLIYIAVDPAPLSNLAEAVAAKTGLSGWMASAEHAPADIGLSTIRLGVPERERPRWLRAALLLTDDTVPLTAAPPSQPH
jgi:anti-sigma factor RsiW